MGGTQVAVKLGLLTVPPLWSAFCRFSLGAACLMLWARLSGVRLAPGKEEWPGLLLLSGLFSVQIGLMNFGVDLSTGALSTIIMATNPLFAALLAHFFIAGDSLRPVRGGGLLVAFAGIFLLFAGGLGEVLRQETAWGNLVVLTSAALLGGRLTFTANLVHRIHPARVMIWQMLLSLPVFALGGFLLEEIDWQALGWRPLAGIAYQGVVVAGFAFTVNAFLLRRYSPSIVFGFNFVAPATGVVMAALLLGEVIGWNVWAGLAAVAAGLVLVNRK